MMVPEQRRGGRAGVPECAEETLGDVVPKSHTHSPGRREGALPPRNDAMVIPDAHVQEYLQSHIFDLYSVGTREGGRRSVPFIQRVQLQKDTGEAVEEDAVIDDGEIANAIDTDTYEAARRQLGELAWTSRVLRCEVSERSTHCSSPHGPCEPSARVTG
jgi:hypothetical protein